MLPTTEICGQEITRLIIGGNPICGVSHFSTQLDEDMKNFFTMAEVKKLLFRCMECGINAMVMRGDRYVQRVIREFRQDGGNLKWITQTAPEISPFESVIGQVVALKTNAIFHQGVATDDLFNKGNQDEIKRRLAYIRSKGVPVGLCTHMPEVIEYAETHKWDLDFYMACVYNFSVPERMKAAAITGNEEPFFTDAAPPIMFQVIRSTKKPCLAFKILAAGRRAKTREEVRAAFDRTFANIKPIDAVVVGMYPKNEDQALLNCQYAKEAIEKAIAK